MKIKLITVSFLFFIVMFLGESVFSCEIEIKPKGDAQTEFSQGQVVVLEVKVFLTHKDCPEGIKSTKFNPTGMTLLGATKWKQVTDLDFIRLVKVKIDSSVTEATLNVGRACDKEGGIGKISLQVKQDVL